MKKKELKQLSKEEIPTKLTELRKELMKLNSQRHSGTAPENPGNIKKIRRTIAQMLTKLKVEGGTKEKTNNNG
jgi:large subunit ribosomal protein L29